MCDGSVVNSDSISPPQVEVKRATPREQSPGGHAGMRGRGRGGGFGRGRPSELNTITLNHNIMFSPTCRFNSLCDSPS